MKTKLLKVICFLAAFPLFYVHGAFGMEKGLYIRADLQHQSYRSTKLYDNQPLSGACWFNSPGGCSSAGWPSEGAGVNPTNTTGWLLGIGYRFSPVLSTDLGYSASNNSHFDFAYGPGTANFDVETRQIMLTGYLDVISLVSGNKPEGPFSTYILLGVGQSRNSNSNYNCSSLAACTAFTYANSNSNTDTAWQTGIGAQYSINKHVAIDVSLKRAYFGETVGKDIPSSSGINAKLVTNILSVGFVVPIGN